MAEPIKIEGDVLASEYKEETPVVETQVEATPVETTNTETTETAQATQPIPFEQKWKEEFGDVEITKVKERYSQFDTVAQELEKYKTTPSYKTDAGKQIDEWLSKGIELNTIVKFKDIKAESLTPEQAIKLKMEIENPKLEAKHINALYESQYTHVVDDLKDDAYNNQNAILKEAALMKDAESAKSFLGDYLNKQFNPSGVLDSAKQREAMEQLGTSWTSNSNVLLDVAKEVKDEISFKVVGKGGEEEVKLNYSYALPSGDLETLTKSAIAAAVQSGIQPTKEGLAQVQNYLQGLVWANHGKKILQSAVNDALSKQAESFQKMIHNPAIQGGGGHQVGNSLTMEEAFLQHEVQRSKGTNN